MLWIPFFPTKNVLHDTNWTFSTRVFSCRFFGNGFSWLFKDLQRLNAQRQKSLFLYQIVVSLAKQCISMVWFTNSWFYLSRKKYIVAMFSCFREKRTKFLLREVYLLAWCLAMLNWSRRHAFIYTTKTWNLGVFFYRFSKVFAENNKKYSTGNEEWIESERATITSDCVLYNHLSIS